jgi:RNA polymerase sigma factor (sigma-70 family)
MPFSWNIVTRNVQSEDPRFPLQKKLREKIAKFEKHLKHFPSDAVHLQIVLERHSRKDLYTSTLTLRVPSHILQSQKSGRHLVEAFDESVKALLRELESMKSNQRGEELWKRKDRREKLHELKASGFGALPLAEGTGPQDHRHMVGDLFQHHYKELLRHVRRHILHNELAGDLPKGTVKAQDVLDEVRRRALARASEGPKEGSWLIWFYRLIHQELKRQRSRFKPDKAAKVSTNESKTLSKEGAKVRRQVDPAEEGLARKDALARLEQDMRKWPRPEREVFELYYVEGIEPEEIAMITRQPLKTVRENIESIQRRLREEILAQEAAA